MTTTTVARDAKPPVALVRVMNPLLRAVLRTRLGRLVGSFALLEFHGRRSGQCYLVPVGWHDLGDEHVVITPARWRANFRGGLPVVVHHRGHARPSTGMLVDDPEVVVVALQRVLDRAGSLRAAGVDVPAGHRVTAEDVVAVDRAILRFDPVAPLGTP